ncbi:MAG: hypothetical protein J7J07_00760, partial [Syntrophobacterales bacterium]|nr:hypothetical protein [Syntrophobacterales bacterium]
ACACPHLSAVQAAQAGAETGQKGTLCKGLILSHPHNAPYLLNNKKTFMSRNFIKLLYDK